MRKSLLLSLSFVSVVTLDAIAGPSAPKAPADVVKAAELERFAAAEKNDLGALDKLLADDLTYTHSTGVLETKAQFIGSLKAGKLKFKKIEPADVQVRVYGKTALINGTAKVSVVSEGQPKDISLRFTDAWVERAGHWQMVAWQSTKLP
jgi:hypothetical protein